MFLLEHLTFEKFNSLRSCLSCSHSTPNSSLQQRKAVVQQSEGVNDLWSAPAADVGGMEVNRDEFFLYRASAYMTDTSNVS